MSNSVDSPAARPMRFSSKPGISRSSPMIERHPLGRPALERFAVARAREPDDRVVASSRRGPRPGQGRVLVAQLVDDLVDLGVVDRLDLGLKLKLRSRRASTSGRTWTVALKIERLALLGLDDLDVGVGQRDDRPSRRAPRGRRSATRCSTASSRTAPGPRTRSSMARGALPGRNPATRVRAQAADGSRRRVERVGGELDLEDDGALGGGGGGDMHRREV